VSLTVEESELVLVAGATGSGKSTLLRTVNGLVPQFTGGHVTGDVLVDGHPVRGTTPRDLAEVVGFVGQDPLSTFVTDVVEEELAYGMEQLGLAPQTMRRRVEETLDLLGVAELRARPLRSLSGGQQQRVAIGAVLTMHPRVLVLDEPTSALDPTAAEDVLSTLARLVEDLGLTVLLAVASQAGNRCPCPSATPAAAPGTRQCPCPALLSLAGGTRPLACSRRATWSCATAPRWPSAVPTSPSTGVRSWP
jgi:energy-coupling factor transport system ATP-binding protein